MGVKQLPDVVRIALKDFISLDRGASFPFNEIRFMALPTTER